MNKWMWVLLVVILAIVSSFIWHASFSSDIVGGISNGVTKYLMDGQSGNYFKHDVRLIAVGNDAVAVKVDEVGIKVIALDGTETINGLNVGLKCVNPKQNTGESGATLFLGNILYKPKALSKHFVDAPIDYSETVHLMESQPYDFDRHRVLLISVGSVGVVIAVDGVTKVIGLDTTKVINGLSVTVECVNPKSEQGASSATFLLSPRGSLVEVGEPEVVMSAEKRMGLGLKIFPDGIFGIFKIKGQYYTFGAGQTLPTLPIYRDGTIRMIGNLENMRPDPVDENGIPLPPISPNRSSDDFDKNYAGGGPVYFDNEKSQLIHIYHAEYYWNDSNSMNFYSSLGFAKSNDLGKNFTKLGEIIRPRIPRENGEQVDISSGSIIKNGDYFYLYFSDKDYNHYIALARAKVSDVLNLAEMGQVANWKKYYNGTFNEPGLGGNSTPLFEVESDSWCVFPSVSYSKYLEKYVMVYMVRLNTFELRLSDDGVIWGEPTLLLRAHGEEAIVYPTIIGIVENQNQLGPEFWVYYTHYEHSDHSYDLWIDAKLMRIKIKVNDS